MFSRRYWLLNRKWLGFAALGAWVIAPLAFGLRDQQRASAQSPASTPATESVLLQDPLAADERWVLAHMQFPKLWQDRFAAAADAQTFESILQEYVSQRGVTGAVNLAERTSQRTIENYRAGRLQLGIEESIPFTQPLQWDRTDRGESFQLELHSLGFLIDFVAEYRKRGDRHHLDLAAAVLWDWARKNPYGNALHPRAWHEGCVSQRIVVLVSMAENYPALRPTLPITLTALLAMIHQHATYLTQPTTYRANGNHGIAQDIGLLTAAKAFPEFNQARHWRDLALSRLRELQIDPGFSREGIWREHSPGYHYVTVQMMSRVSTLAPEWDRAEFLSQLHLKSNAYLAHVLTPSGCFPPVGDSFETRMNLEHMTDSSLLYVHTRGQQGEPPPDLDGFYPDAGEVIFRDTWGRPDRPADQACYIHIHAASHLGFGHRHQDDLSFLMHALGRWWIVEAGKFSYDRVPMRTFVLSAQAHNGVTFNNEALTAPVKRKQGKTARVDESWVSTSQIAAARASTNRFGPADVLATRTYVFLRQRQTLVLIDHLQSPGPGSWQGYIHLAPDLNVQLTGTTLTATAPTHPSMRLSVVTEAGENTTARIAKGQNDPLLGWYSPAYRKIVPTPVLMYERTGTDLCVATIIHLGEATSPAPADVQTRPESEAHVTTWRQGDELMSLRTSDAPPLRVTLSLQ